MSLSWGIHIVSHSPRIDLLSAGHWAKPSFTLLPLLPLTLFPPIFCRPR